jgi:anti-anti-sigma factor
MTTPITLTPGRRADGTAVLSVAGEIDMSNVNAFADAVLSATGLVIIDLTAVEYLDSAALAVLFAHAHRIELIAPPVLTSVLTISGLGELITIHGLPSDAAN